jgi:HK97 family phage major capsid protein
MATDWSGLLPQAVSDNILSATEEQSVVLGLANTRPMAAGVESVPLLQLAPEAKFIDRGERKPIGVIEWSAARLEAEEVACVVAVADVDIQDAGPDLEASVERELGGAVARALDAAVLFGTGAPTSFPTGGIVPASPATGATALEALDAALAAIEATGVMPDGIASGVQINSALRKAYIDAGALPGDTVEQRIFGLPVRVTSRWDSTRGDAVVGGWQYLQIGVRQDITVDISTDGVLLNPDDTIAVSAFQDDATLIRCHARFGCAVGKPVQPDGSGVVEPFKAADWSA